jgi:hypothetical protein
VGIVEDFHSGNDVEIVGENVESDASLLNTSEETRHSLNGSGPTGKHAGQKSSDASLYSLAELRSDGTPSLPFLKEKTSSSKTKEEELFTEFWNAYPRRQQKQDARKAWTQQRRKGAKPEQLITGAKGYAEYCQQKGTDSSYNKLPASWLRAGGYDDHQPTTTPQKDLRDPVDVLRAFWKTADAPAVAKLLRIPFVDKGQPPSDPTPHTKWKTLTRQAWITNHFQEAVEALKKSREDT